MASTASPEHTIGFLGPKGTFTEQALLTQPDLAAATIRPFASMAEVLLATAAGELDFGFVPIENSIEGTVNATIDTLAFSSSLLIQREVDLPITMQLLANPGVDMAAIKQVMSYPHAIGQCREWLAANLPDIEMHAAASTADAVQMLAESGATDTAAIANSLAGKRYGLTTIASDIADHAQNETRFVLVSSEGTPPPTGHDKTSIVVFQRADRPGSLLSILQEFAARSINIVKLSSRPTKARMGEYCFIMDFDGHIADELVADCLRNIHAKQAELKFLGSYPAIGAGAHETRAEASESWQSADAWMQTLRSAIEN